MSRDFCVRRKQSALCFGFPAWRRKIVAQAILETLTVASSFIKKLLRGDAGERAIWFAAVIKDDSPTPGIN